jgi:hypothetical protein
MARIRFSALGRLARLGLVAVLAFLVATTFFAASTLADVTLEWEGEDMTFSSAEVSIANSDSWSGASSYWSGGAALKYKGEARASRVIALSGAGDSVTIRGKALTDPANPGAWPVVEVYKDNAQNPANKIATFTINTTTFDDYTASAAIPRDTKRIFVKAAGNMAGEQIFWLDKASVNKKNTAADTTPPETTIDAGPSSTSAAYNGDPSFSFSSSEPNSTFECKLDNGSWAACSSPKGYSGLANGEHTFSVRAIDQAGNVDASPATRQWSVWACNGTQVAPGDDLDAIVNGDPSGTATTFCLAAGTHVISSTLQLRSGDSLIGSVGQKASKGPATYGFPTAHIHDGTHNITRLINVNAGATAIKWVEISGATGAYSGSTTVDPNCQNWVAGKGCTQAGTGAGVGMGTASDSFVFQWNYVHNNEAQGITSARGHLLNNHFTNNTSNPDFLGFTAASIKGIAEYEAAYNYIHNEQGNGIWCDHACADASGQSNGFWAHDNFIVNNGRWGVRYEYSPKDVGEDVVRSQPTALVEDNRIHGNGREVGHSAGGISMHDAQNGVFDSNVLGSATIDGTLYPENEGDGIQFADSNRTDRTDLWNGTASNNTLNGENVTNCGKMDTDGNPGGQVVFCFNNAP